jgi:hypothetical protein
MGTRNLTCVVLGGEFRVAQYGQFDGYPEGQGKTILEFLQTADLDEFKKKVALCRFGTDKEIEEAYAPYMTSEFGMNADDSNRFYASDVGHLGRDIAGTILELIMKSKNGLMLQDCHTFASETSCNWAYVVDLDNGRLEVYKQRYDKELVGVGRFADLKDGPYAPCSFIMAFSLQHLPTVKEFCDEIESMDSRIESGHVPNFIDTTEFESVLQPLFPEEQITLVLTKLKNGKTRVTSPEFPDVLVVKKNPAKAAAKALKELM